MAILESGENYLETILLLEQQNKLVRSIDIANKLGYSKPSVSRAMGILKKAGLIIMEANGHIHLTDSGREKATEVYERHQLITKFLMLTLGIDEALADEDACRIEHIISSETAQKIREFVDANAK